MAKAKNAYVCNECGADFRKWQGQCGECGAWNSLSEVRLSAPGSASSGGGYAGQTGGRVQKLDEISLDELPRFFVNHGRI